MNKLNISVIIPIESSKHKNFDTLFESAVKSVQNQLKTSIKGDEVVGDIELVLVHSDEESLVSFISEYDFSNINTKFVVNDGETDFSSQVNLGITNASHEWVTILEFDDEISSIWFRNVSHYVDVYHDYEAFLPIVVDTNEQGVFAGFTNEATFAANMNSEIGVLTNEVLLNYQNFQTSGMVFKKSLFEKYGGFKKSIKLTFVYELLLRLTYNSVNMMTIPRIGYKHSNMREGSIFWNYKNGETPLTQDEITFWIDGAKKEHFCKEDRNIKFEPSEV